MPTSASTRRYHLRHVTTYEYSSDATMAHHDLCLQLRDLPYQQVHNPSIRVEPEPDTIVARRDTFGNWRHFLAIEQVHEALRVVAEATIDVSRRDVPVPLSTLAWEQVRSMVNGDGFPNNLLPLECSLASPGVSVEPEIAAYARQSFVPGRPILEAARELNQRIFEDFTYEPGATGVSTPVADAFAAKRGVCQDFAQIAISGLRGLGLAARYVSGYIRTTGGNQSAPDPAAQKALEKAANLKVFYIRNMVDMTGKELDEVLSDYEKINTEFREKNSGLLERNLVDKFEEECKALLTETNCRMKFVEEVVKMTGEKKEQVEKEYDDDYKKFKEYANENGYTRTVAVDKYIELSNKKLQVAQFRYTVVNKMMEDQGMDVDEANQEFDKMMYAMNQEENACKEPMCIKCD